MSHRNNDNNPPWNNRSSRNNSDGGSGVGGSGGYKNNWAGGNRYNPDNRYNKDRRNYRGYGGRRNYDDRRGGNPYRNNSWSNNSSMDGNFLPHPRHPNNWHQKNTDKGGKFGPGNETQCSPHQMMPHEIMHQIPPMLIDFNVPEQEKADDQIVAASSASTVVDKTNGVQSNKGGSEQSDSTKSWINDSYASPGDGFQGFPDMDHTKPANGGAVDNSADLDFTGRQSSTPDDKTEMTPQENELIKLIEDEALKMITDSEPSCSTSSQNNCPDNTATAAVPTSSSHNPERRATIERSAEQVTRKLINQLTTMNKYSLKQMINNPDSKYETALKTHARQKLRAEVRRQLRNFSLNDSATQTKTSCGMLEPDECVDSDKIPDALLEQIGKVLDLNLLDLNVSEEQPQVPTAEDEDSVINQSEADYSATEVLDKNLRLNDDDGQLNLDADDIFARAELLLMKGSESIHKSNTSGPSSPTEEMFPNDQIDSIVSEENGYEKVLELSGNEENKVEDLLDEPLAPVFPIFLRVNTVEELNKKVDNLPTPADEKDNCVPEETKLSIPPSAELPFVPPNDVSENVCGKQSPENNPTSENATNTVTSQVTENSQTVDAAIEQTKGNDVSEKQSVEDVQVVPKDEVPAVESTLIVKEETTTTPKEQESEEIKSENTRTASPEPAKQPTSELSSSAGTIRAPTHPELATRKSKGSKTYKPNLVAHEHSKRDSKSSPAPASRSSSTLSPSSSNSSSSHSKSHTKPGPNLAASRQTSSPSPAKHHSPNPNSGSNNSSSANNNHSSRERSQRKRDSSIKENNVSSSNSHNISSSATNANSGISDSVSKSSNSGTLLVAEVIQTTPPKEPSPPVPSAVKMYPVRARTPGPTLAAAQHESSFSGSKKKKKKRNRRKDHSPDIGMMLECDLRVSRPLVTPTPPPTQSRDVTPGSSKKNNDLERPSRETRAKSVDPKTLYDSKRDRDRGDKDRNKEKSRGRNSDEKRETDRDAKKEKSKDDRRETEREDRRDKEKDKEKEIKKEKENGNEKEEKKEKTSVPSNGIQIEPIKNNNQQAELSVPKSDRERRKSPTPKVSLKSSDPLKHSKDSKEPKEAVQENPREVCKEEETVPTTEPTKETPKEKENRDLLLTNELGAPVEETTKDVTPEKVNRDEPREKEIPKEKVARECVKEKEAKDTNKGKELKNISKGAEMKMDTKNKEPRESRDVSKDSKETPDVPTERPHKRKKSLLRGPNLIKGRKEVVIPEVAVPTQSDITNNRREPAPQETVPPVQPSVPKCQTDATASESVALTQPTTYRGRRAVIVPDVTVQSAPAMMLDHSALFSTAASLVQRTASPRPWKSPGEKKIIPATPLLPTLTATVSPMSPPPVDRPTPTPTPTPPMAMSPEHQPVQHVPSSVITQPDVLARIPLSSTLGPLAASQMSPFTPVMTLLNQMQEIDNKMSEFQRRKMQIDSEMMKLNSEKFQIDQSSMQLQSDRFMVLNALRAALVECELNTLAAVQTAPHITAANSVVTTRKRVHEPELETATKSKRRKEVEFIPNSPQPAHQLASSTSAPDSSEPEEAASTTNATATGGERTIRKITKISGNTQILKLFQRRRLISDKSAEESQSEDNAPPPADKQATTKRRRTRTTTANEEIDLLPRTGRLRSNSNRSVELRNSVDLTQKEEATEAHSSVTNLPAAPPAASTSTALFRRDEEIPLVAHRNVLTRQVKVVLSKINVDRKGSNM